MNFTLLGPCKPSLNQTLEDFKNSRDQIFQIIDYTVLKLNFVQDIFNFFSQFQCERAPLEEFTDQLSLIKLGSLESYTSARRVFKTFKKTFAQSLKLTFERESLHEFNSESCRKAFLNYTLQDRFELWNEYSTLYFKFTRLLTQSSDEPAKKRLRVWEEFPSYESYPRNGPESPFYNGQAFYPYNDIQVHSYNEPWMHPYSYPEAQSYHGTEEQAYNDSEIKFDNWRNIQFHNEPVMQSDSRPEVLFCDRPIEQSYKSPEAYHFSHSEIPPTPSTAQNEIDPREKEIGENNEIRQSNATFSSSVQSAQIQGYINKAIGLKEEILAYIIERPRLTLWDSQTNVIETSDSAAIHFDANESYAVEVMQDSTVNLYGELCQVPRSNAKQSLLNFNDRITIPHSLSKFEAKIDVVSISNSKVAFGLRGPTLRVYELDNKRIHAEKQILKISDIVNIRSIGFSQGTQKTKEHSTSQNPFVGHHIHSLHLTEHWVATAAGGKNALVAKLTEPEGLPLVFRYRTGVKVVKIYQERLLLSATNDQLMLLWNLETLQPIYNINHSVKSEGAPLDLIPVEQGFYALFGKSKSIYYYDTRQAQGINVFTNKVDINNIILTNEGLYATTHDQFLKLRECSQSSI